MSGINEIANVWKNLKEVDLRPLREAALRPVKLAIVGKPGLAVIPWLTKFVRILNGRRVKLKPLC